MAETVCTRRCAYHLIIHEPSGGHPNIFVVEAADPIALNHPALLRQLRRSPIWRILIWRILI
jgi:hypothetical protein